ncbi:MAG: hypothetical protein WCA49_19495 [Candidatus Sulfotelmatobacter sp.]
MALGNVPRCQHIKMNGTQCGSPALRRKRRCFFHERAREQHNRIVNDQFKQARFVLPVLEDGNAIQMALMQVMQLLAWGQMDRKTAGLLLFALQTATSNLRNVNFEPEEPTDVVINREDVQRTDIGGPQWDPDDFEWEEEEDEAEEQDAEEDDAVTPAAAVAAAQEAKDSPAASVDAAENAKAAPSMDQVRKEIRGLVHNYIMETGRTPTELSG